MDDRRGIGGGQREGGGDVLRALHEELYRIGVCGLLPRRGQGEGRHQPRLFAGDAKRLPARYQDPQRRTAPQEPIDEDRGRTDDVLTVVHHQEGRTSADERDQRVQAGPVHLLAQTQGRRNLRIDVGRVRQCPEVDPADRVAIAALQAGSDCRGEPALAASSRPHERYEPAGSEQCGDLADLLAPADQRREMDRKWRAGAESDALRSGGGLGGHGVSNVIPRNPNCGGVPKHTRPFRPRQAASVDGASHGPMTRVTPSAILLALSAASAFCAREGSIRGERTHTVEMRGYAFEPERIAVAPGDTIARVNRVAVPHTVTAAGRWDSGSIAAGGSCRRVVEGPDSIGYYCTFHPTMKGAVTSG